MLARELETLQPKIIGLVDNGDFIGSFIDHEPNFRSTFVFAKDVDVNKIREILPISLRSSVATKKSRYNAQQIDDLQRQITKAVADAKISGFDAYDIRTDKFEVTGDASTQNLVNRLPPSLRDNVRFVEGGLPTLVQSSGAIYGGWTLYSSDSPECTYSFVVKYSAGANSITTASHCPLPGSYANGSAFTPLPSPSIDKNVDGTGRGYDYRISATGSVTTGAYVWFSNNRTGTYYQRNGTGGWDNKSWANVNPNYPTDGAYTQVTGVILGASSNLTNPNHVVGSVRCLGGMTTGITCGQITSSSADAVVTRDGVTKTYRGYVRVSSSDYMVLAFGGDSGGPVMTEPTYNSTAGYYQARAAGIITIGSQRDRGDGYNRPCVSPGDGECPAYYMPIDRINDHVGATIVTTSGNVSPN